MNPKIEAIALLGIFTGSLLGFRECWNELKALRQSISYAELNNDIGHALTWGEAEKKFRQNVAASNVISIAFGPGTYGGMAITNDSGYPVIMTAANGMRTIVTNMVVIGGTNGPFSISGFTFDLTGSTNAYSAISIYPE